ncbi:TonB-dependent receptor [Alphaproteobacteria bacterium]|nr:TonB-dependent receptor [Alphaproteobacteria bacterium]
MNKKITAAFAASLLFVLLAFAPHAKAEEVDEIIVSATGIPTPISQIGSSVDVITAKDLEQQQITYLQDALATVAGISTYQSGGPGSTSNVFMRGMTGKYSGVYVDGVQINDPASQQAAWAYLPTHGLESVEVLRGSQGVLYGSEAIGGAISMFTAVGGENQNRIDLQSGSFGTNNIALSSRGEVRNLDYGLAIEQTDSDGISAANENDGNTEEDGYESLSARGRFVVNVSENLSIDLALRSISSEIETDSSAPVDAVGYYTDFDAVGGRFSLIYDTGDVRHEVSHGKSEDVSSAYTARVLTTEGEREATSYRGIFRVSENVDVLFGAEQEKETYRTGSNLYDTQTDALFLLMQFADAQGFSASFAARQDDNEVFGKFDTNRVALKKMYRLFGFRGSYGTGFRAPSLYEMFGRSDYCADNKLCGNENLMPEESRSHDIAIIFTPRSNLTMEIARFDITVSDFIKYGSVTPEDVNDPCLAMNSFGGFVTTTCGRYEQTDGDSKSQGYEMRLNLQLSDTTSIAANYTKLDAVKESGERDIRRPEDTLNVSVNHEVSDFLHVGGQVQVVKNVTDTNFSVFPNVDVPLDDHTLLNLHASYQLPSSSKVYARIENALDEDYETALGYGTPGRAFYIGVSSSF